MKRGKLSVNKIQLCYENGEFQREALLLAIESGRLSRKELQNVLSENDIKKQFFGCGDFPKESKRYWDDLYQQELYWKVREEEFNPDGLLHLEEVSRVSRKRESLDKIYRVALMVFTGVMIAEGFIRIALALHI